MSPTDNMMTPCSQKLNQTKKKHFAKYVPSFFLFARPARLLMSKCTSRGVAKPMPSLFGQQQKEASSDSDSEDTPEAPAKPTGESKMDEDENPF